MGAAAGFVVLAFGSGDGGTQEAAEDFGRANPSVAPVEPAPSPEPAVATPAAPDGQCCCTFLESDAPVTRFESAAMCKQVQGTCEASVDACVAYQKAMEAKAETCCCSATEKIIQQGEPCDGECYDFYEEADAPGSCIY